ncbi:MAG: glycosyltransferase family 39 protein [Ktedonobacterales bacterium]
MNAIRTARPTILSKQFFSRANLTSDNAILVYLALAGVVAHLLVSNNYGYFRDELYYMADGRHLSWGYVDQAPLIGWLAALIHVTLGDSLVAIHILPAFASGTLVFVTGLIARELGGGRLAQVLAASATLVAPVFMATGSLFSMDVLDQLLWALGALILIRLVRRDEPRLWLAFGLVAGIGLLNKYTILFFGFSLVVGMLVTPARRYFRTRWPWLGGLIAFAFLVPDLLWNATHGWPTWDFWHHYQGLTGGGPIGFLADQILNANPFTLPLIVAGLYFYLRSKNGKPYRAFGWAFVTLVIVFVVINAKAYFLAPAFPMLFAAGGRQVESLNLRQAWLKPAYVVVLLLSGVLLAPLAMPVLPPATYATSYAALTGVGNRGAGQQTAGIFPQYLGDRFGWDTMTATVAQVYDSLPADQRSHACIFTVNYGEAGALELLGTRYHLRAVVSGHNNYYIWGPGSCDGSVIITVGVSQSDLTEFAHVTQAATITCSYCMTEEDNIPVYVCTGLRDPLQDVWLRVKHFN